jgi:hypothetical protein
MTFIELLVIGIPIALWAVMTGIFAGRRYEMDHGHSSRGSFFAIGGWYWRLYLLVFGVALILAVFTALNHLADTTVMLTAAAVYALLFNGWMAFCYESYLRFRYSVGTSNYTAPRYALTLSLAFSSLGLFIAGLISGMSAILERQ